MLASRSRDTEVKLGVSAQHKPRDSAAPPVPPQSFAKLQTAASRRIISKYPYALLISLCSVEVAAVTGKSFSPYLCGHLCSWKVRSGDAAARCCTILRVAKPQRGEIYQAQGKVGYFEWKKLSSSPNGARYTKPRASAHRARRPG